MAGAGTEAEVEKGRTVLWEDPGVGTTVEGVEEVGGCKLAPPELKLGVEIPVFMVNMAGPMGLLLDVVEGPKGGFATPDVSEDKGVVPVLVFGEGVVVVVVVGAEALAEPDHELEPKISRVAEEETG